MAKRYGPIFYLKVGVVPMVVVSSPEMAQEVLKTHDKVLCSRPKMPNAYRAAWSKLDMLWAPAGQFWRNARKVCSTELLTAQRLQKADFQNIRKSEVELFTRWLLSEFQQDEDKPLNTSQYSRRLVYNIISRMVLGRRFYNMSTSQTFCECDPGEEIFAELLYLLGSPNISDFLPFLTVFDLAGLQKRGKALNAKMDKYLQSIIDARSQPSNRHSSPGEAQTSKGTFVEQLFKIRAETRGALDVPDDDCLSINSIKGLIMDMVAGGSITSAIVLEWTFSELMRHPQVMKRAQAELDRVVGPNRLVTEADIPHLKYLQAIVKETFRLHPPAPIVGPHFSTEECEIAGYRIPANTQVFVSTYSIHRDPSVWDRPLEFDPERFLNSEVEPLGAHYELLPFGSGRRMCPGFNLGMLMVQYPLAQSLHAFTWELPKGQKPEEVDITGAGGAFHCKAVPLFVVPRPRLDRHVYSAADIS